MHRETRTRILVAVAFAAGMLYAARFAEPPEAALATTPALHASDARDPGAAAGIARFEPKRARRHSM